ncbi:tetratricopeptide repeat protein [Sinimarinibacterium sp. CAU 1509]|uniref:tetratricopeptide repeat protein n=1 Tax=Sinimarinibacterium sp. CAU 1509 TaxID=2562283 RepID=UPI001B7FC74F|nr:tetratricopeptide repeat protein [Sinimarinibacterium sp. CAU 1509]
MFFAALGCSACALPRPLDSTSSGSQASKTKGAEDSVDRAVYRDLIGSMLDQHQYYAALAHVQQQQQRSGNTPELKYLEAEARRNLGQVAQADALYRSLLRSDMAAEAYHGLGLLHARQRPAQAVAYLQEAARRRPTDAEIRNDLGYALLSMRRYDEALPEFSTAVELAPGLERARNNLLLLLLARRDEAAASKMIREAGISSDTVARLRRQASSFMAPQRAVGGVQ